MKWAPIKDLRTNQFDKGKKMKISLLAKLTFFGLAYIYTTKLIDTLYHGIFRPASLAGVVVGLNILAGLVQLLFFLVLYRQFVPKDKPALRTGACLAITGSAVGLLPKLLAMALLFQTPSLFFFIQHGAQIGAFCPWVKSVLLLTFSLIFISDYRIRHDKPLKRAFGAGVIGWFIMAAAQTLVVINYLSAGRLVWLADLFSAGPFVFVTTTSVTFLCLFVFYLTFARL